MEFWRFIKKHDKTFITVFLLIIVVPIAINILYKIELESRFFATEWSSGEMLNYFGILLAALFALIGIHYTIQDGKERDKEQFRLSSLPRIALISLRKDYKIDAFRLYANEAKEDEKSGIYYLEKRLEKFFFIIEQGETIIKDSLNEKQKQNVERLGLNWIDSNNGAKVLAKSNIISLPFEVENIGNGAAVAFQFGLNRKDQSEKKFTHMMTLRQSDKLYLMIYAEEPDTSSRTDYELLFAYEDILGNRYEQNFTFSIPNNYPIGDIKIDVEAEQTLRKSII